MASNFAFQAFGMSQAVTVGGAAPATISLTVTRVGTTATLALASGNYPVGGVRIANEGTASAFIQFSDTAANMTVSPTNGMRVLGNTAVTFRCMGTPFIGLVCNSTFTVTLSVTPGEGL